MIYWDPKPDLFTIPYLNWPILWYGVLFAGGFVLGFPLYVSLLTRYLMHRHVDSARKKALMLTDRLTVYMVVATIVGARLGHFLFYEKPATYWRDPWELFRIWEGGLASHGAIVAIPLALMLFSYRIRGQVPGLTWLRLLDIAVVPAALIAFFIRVGNFFNQEILGVPTDLPWGVVFGHPADHSLPIPRHPVQLYEALFYLGVFSLLWALSRSSRWLCTLGRLSGLFLLCVFGFRFCIEFLKMEQSHLIMATHFPLTMGQILSLPALGLGAVFFLWNRLFKSSILKK